MNNPVQVYVTVAETLWVLFNSLSDKNVAGSPSYPRYFSLNQPDGHVDGLTRPPCRSRVLPLRPDTEHKLRHLHILRVIETRPANTEPRQNPRLSNNKASPEAFSVFVPSDVPECGGRRQRRVKFSTCRLKGRRSLILPSHATRTGCVDR